MTVANASLRSAEPSDPGASLYRPGECNIGPAEIARRRRAGHVGLVSAVILLVLLIVAGLPAWTRLLIAIPAVLSASGYIQARMRFCAAYGWRGVFNFETPGQMEGIGDPESRARDLTRARQIGFASLVIGLAAGILAMLLPV